MKILFLVPYPLHESPSQRFRFEQYLGLLLKEGHSYRVQSFLDSGNWRLFFNPGNLFGRVIALLKGFAKRFSILFRITSYDFIFIHREIAPIGPPALEWIIANVFKKKIIYDFDDAIWLTDRTSESGLLRMLKWRNKVQKICSWSHKVSCGNEYLATYARRFNKRVIYNPTTIDTEKLHLPQRNPAISDAITIGWTGTHSTLKYLTLIEPVLKRLERRFSHLTFIVIADKRPVSKLNSLKFIPWSLEHEIADLNQIDIGIMPLPDDDWSKGKCGFKGLQYMALEIPVVASAVGVNPEIIQHSVDGFLVSSEEDWMSYLTKLIEDPQLRLRIGYEGRKKVIKAFSVRSNIENFFSLFA